MKKIPVSALRAGQIFTEPVYIEGNSLLVPAGIAVRMKDIERLKGWGVETVSTEGDAATDSGAAAPSGPSNALSKSSVSHAVKGAAKSAGSKILSLPAVQENKSVYRTYMDLIERLEAIFEQLASGLSVETRSIDAIASRLLAAVRESRDQIIGFILGGEVSGHELAKSSVNSSILSTLIAMEMKLPNHKILHIATGALLHDVGMIKLPRELVDKKGGLSEAEIQRMKAHPLYAFKIVCKELLYPEDVGLIALQHHERWDGEGYPRRLAGEAIELGARIVTVADAFEAMVSEKPYRNSMIGYAAMKSLLSDNSRRFDPDVLKAFIKTMGIYPIGSIVLLNNGAVARVVEVHGEAPLRPRIRILIDDFGKAYEQDEGETVDLLAEKSLFIARAINPKEFAAQS
jgi:HD-GYP domain-containing protein (c-di-GMP phosphodiesterase class II)